MIIQHLKFPFSHTIIYDVFNELEMELIKKEISNLIPAAKEEIKENDIHHKILYDEYHTLSMSLDVFYQEKRESSKILSCVRNLFSAAANGTLSSQDNEFINYISASNLDITHLQIYKNNSSYFTHKDNAILTALYPIHLGDEFDGGELKFVNYNYTPYLSSNCCLIFPSYQPHSLGLIKTKSDEYVRASINQRLYIK